MALSEKIRSMDELAVIVNALKNQGKKIVHCHGVFDLLHPGHLRHFISARALGDILIVTTTADQFVDKGPGRPVFPQELRAEFIAALESVDYVAINHSPYADEMIRRLKPDIFAKGKEFENVTREENPNIHIERDTIKEIGGEMCFTGDIVFSSSSLINEFFEVYPKGAQEFLKTFRKKYSVETVIDMVKGLKDLKVLVIGETILDKYAFMAPMMSKPPKGHHIAARFVREETHAGGVLACANHLANFCGQVNLITAIGNDGNDDFIMSHLKPNIRPILFYYDQAPTIVKKRFIDNSFLAKLFEEYIIDDRPSPELENIIKHHLNCMFSASEHYDLILVLDYGHGLLTPNLIKLICDQKNFLAVNAQTNTANMGFNPITKYPRANFYCLDDRELRMAFHDQHIDIETLTRRLGKKVSRPGGVAVTLGHLGSITYDEETGFFYNAPVLSQKIVDTTGAGDAFFALTAPCVARGFPMDLVAFIGNVAGALAVGILGNQSSIEPAPLYKFITALLK